MKQLIKSQKGQTLVEVLAGLGMILIVVTALIGMGIVALKASTSARNRTVAAKLANEGMELVRSARDQNTWTAFLVLSWPDEDIEVDGDGTDDFTRETDTSSAGAGKELVEVVVKWDESSGEKSTSVTSFLTDWR